MLQLVPMRPYFNGEVVAVDAANLSVAVAAAGGEDAGLVYAEIDVPPPTTGRRDRIALRVGSSRTVVHCLPLHVHSFRSQRRTAGGGRGGAEADVTNGGRRGGSGQRQAPRRGVGSGRGERRRHAYWH